MQARNPKVHLLVFADNVNENEYAQMAGKLIEEARALNIFATIRGLTAEDLSNMKILRSIFLLLIGLSAGSDIGFGSLF